MQKAADLMARKLHDGKVVLLGDVFEDKRVIDEYNKKWQGEIIYPPSNPFDMDAFKSMHALEYPMDYCTNTVDSRKIVEPFDFDKYNGIKR